MNSLAACATLATVHTPCSGSEGKQGRAGALRASLNRQSRLTGARLRGPPSSGCIRTPVANPPGSQHVAPSRGRLTSLLKTPFPAAPRTPMRPHTRLASVQIQRISGYANGYPFARWQIWRCFKFRGGELLGDVGASLFSKGDCLSRHPGGYVSCRLYRLLTTASILSRGEPSRKGTGDIPKRCRLSSAPNWHSVLNSFFLNVLERWPLISSLGVSKPFVEMQARRCCIPRSAEPLLGNDLHRGDRGVVAGGHELQQKLALRVWQQPGETPD